MRNTLVTAVVAVLTAIGVTWWTAPDVDVAPVVPIVAETVSPTTRAPVASVPTRQDAAGTAVRPKRPMEHGLVPMTSRVVGWPDVSVVPLAAPVAADEGLDWDTVAWSGEEGEVIDPEWFGD